MLDIPHDFYFSNLDLSEQKDNANEQKSARLLEVTLYVFSHA